MFLRNAWYVAAWSHEIGHSLHPMRILGEEIVLYRTEDDTPVALENACPHRKLPLSKGCLKGDVVECGYHGLTFDRTGACVAAPTQQGSIPGRAKVHSYSVVDRYRLLWIWMGEPEKANPEEIFQIANFDNLSWGCTDGGVMDMACNYLWVTDNLLDPSHVAWVHVTSFAGAGTDDKPLDLSMGEQSVTVSRWIYDQPPSPYYKDLVQFDGNCDRCQHYEMFYPGIGLNKSIYTPVGEGGPDRPVTEKTYINISYNFMTPLDENNTRYFWFQHRNTDPGNAEVSKFMNDGAVMAFNEDKEILELVHQGMAAKKNRHIDLGLDAGALRFRLHLSRMIDAEQAHSDAS